MIQKTQVIVPLETIYEESGNYSTSDIDIPHKLNINIQQQQQQSIDNNKLKPPIEVQYLDGSKRFIHPSTSEKVSSINKHVSFNKSFNKSIPHVEIKPKVTVTIINADDLIQARITPTISSSSEECDLLSTSRSQSNASISTNTTKSIHEVSFEQIFNEPINRSTNYLLKRSDVQQPILINRGQNPSVSVVKQHRNTPLHLQSVSHSKTHSVSSKASLIDNEIRINSLNNCNQQNARKRTPFGGGTYSAFRPFLKPVRFNQQTHLNKSQNPLNTNPNSFNTSQTLKSFPFIQYQKQNLQTSTYLPKRLREITLLSSDGQSISDTSSVSTNSFTFEQNLTPVSTSTRNIPQHPKPNVSFPFNSNFKWYNITSNSIYEIPRLSKQFSNVPLNIVISDAKPNYNPNFTITNDMGFENRLLKAGLLPETVALYKRILNVAEGHLIPVYHQSSLVTDQHIKHLLG